jgi:hypothetical protein
MTPAQSRVVDPVLSEHARGYRQGNLVGRALFPLAPVAAYAGQVIEFGKEAFRLYSTKRAPGARVARVQFGYAGKPYAILPSALDVPVPRELSTDAAAVPGIDLGRRATNLAMRSVYLEHEHACATIARNTANYSVDNRVALSGSSRWTSPTSTPIANVETGKEAIRAKVGLRPNTMVISPKALSALKVHPDLVGRTATNITRTVSIALLQDVFEIPNIVVADATLATGAADTLSDAWGTDVILAYVAQPTGQEELNNEEPSYGYTYYINGHPAVEEPRWDPDTRSWVYGISFDNSPVLAGMDAGYLIGAAGSPAS